MSVEKKSQADVQRHSFAAAPAISPMSVFRILIHVAGDVQFAARGRGGRVKATTIVEPFSIRQWAVDLSRFDAAPLIAFPATKETDYGTEVEITNKNETLAGSVTFFQVSVIRA